MKKLITIVLTLLMLCSFALPASATTTPVITQQPQSPVYGENAKAVYSVTVQGAYLRCSWYLEFEGETYDLSGGTADHPWKAHVSGFTTDHTLNGNYVTFTCTFSDITAGLNGSCIYAKIDDGHVEIDSAKAYIQVTADAKTPPSINVPVEMQANRGEILDLSCQASVTGNAELSYLWYETATGNLQDIAAISGSEGKATLRVNTETCGTRYYVCLVTTADGGKAYSSVITVTVTEPAKITTTALPDATQGQEYKFQLEATGDNVTFAAENAGQLTAAGLTLTQDGVLQGTPTKTGKFPITITAENPFGKDQIAFTLQVAEGQAVLLLIEAPLKETYKVGETLDLTGMKVLIQNPDGTTTESLNGKNLTVTTEPFTQAGEQVVQVQYGESTLSLHILVEEAAETEPTEPSTEATEPTPGQNVSPTDGNNSNHGQGSYGGSYYTPRPAPDQDQDSGGGIPWWLLLIAVIAAAGVGVCVTILIMQKKPIPPAPVPPVAPPSEEPDHGYADVPQDVGLEDSADMFFAESTVAGAEAMSAPSLTEPAKLYPEDTAEDTPEQMRSLFDE